MSFEWNRSEVIGLAKEACTQCHGFGLRYSSRQGQDVPCNCVFRSVFRSCLRKFKECASQEKHVSRVRMELMMNGKEHRQTWGMKDEEYMADFILVTKRTLDPFEYQLFRFHFLLGADYRLCGRRLKMERGDFFHAVYRIQNKLGRVFRELQPYALFPLDEYFGGRVCGTAPRPQGKVVAMVPAPAPRQRLLPPLRKAA